jgi:hypothetical protein
VAELSTVADCLKAFYRLVGTTSDDDAMSENGEAADEVAYLYLTRGARSAQVYLIALGMSERWKSSATLSFGSAAVDGTRDANLPADFLRASGDRVNSALWDGTSGKRWGRQVEETDIRTALGDYYALVGEKVRVANGASIPSTPKLDYIASHAAIAAASTLDFPTLALWMVPAEAAYLAMAEPWFIGDAQAVAAIERARTNAREEAKQYARRTREPRRITPTRIYGSHW